MSIIFGDAATSIRDARRSAEARMKIAGTMLCLTAVLVACSAPPPPETPEQERDNALSKQQDCADPDWQRNHLGLWYDICRRNALQ